MPLNNSLQCSSAKLSVENKEIKRKKKTMPFRQDAVVGTNFLDFQANIIPLLFKPNERKFPIQGFWTRKF
jgi:hypothetical protein